MSSPPTDHSPHFGKQLAEELGLPTSIFVPEQSFAFASADASEAEKRQTIDHTVHGPSARCGVDSKERTIQGSMAQQFLQLNRRFLRGHEDARLWSRSQRRDLIHRLGSGGAVIVAKV